MAAPNNYSLTITVNSVDVTAYVPFESIRFDDHARSVSYLSFKIENPSGVTPTRQHEVTVVANDLADTPTIFSGYITELRDTKRDNGITKVYEVECADQKIRLQKSVIDAASLSGLDSDILGDLLTYGYPDLSSLFNFSSAVTSFTDSIDLPTGNKNILDALKDLADLAGGANFRFENVYSNGDLITFDPSVDVINLPDAGDSATDPQVSINGATAGGSPSPDVVSSNGNPGWCARHNPTSGSWASNEAFQLVFDIASTGSPNTLNNITFDYYISSDIVSGATIVVIVTEDDLTQDTYTFSSLTANAWTTINVAADAVSSQLPTDIGNTFSNPDIVIQLKTNTTYGNLAIVDFDMRFDNIALDLDTSFGNGLGTETQLVWDADPDLADFNIDIDSGDEFAFDIDLELGDFDDYNSVTVVGGFAEDAIDWTYESRGEQDHIDLELPIDDIAVYENTNTDASPTWSALTVGVFGTDDLSSKDVLYDEVDHWLYFASNPPDLAKSIRVTGTIRRPIRVRVEDVPDGEPTYATTIYNSSITSQDQAVAIAESQLAKRTEVRRMTFKTYEPGLKPGQSITVTDSNRGLNETITIQRITTQWIGGKHALFTVYCGEDEGTSADILIADNDKRSRQNAEQIVSGTSTVVFVTDDSGVYLTDDSGRKLYYEA